MTPMDGSFDQVRKLEETNRKLKANFQRLYGIIANTLMGSKWVVKWGGVGVAWRWQGHWVAALVLGYLVLLEALEMGHKRMLELQVEMAKLG